MRFGSPSSLLLAFSVAALGFNSSAYAGSPHFVRASASLSTNGDLNVTFKEAGLGANVNIDYEAKASAEAVWACITGGGKNPSAANKKTISSEVAKPATLSSGKNGSITGRLTLDIPTPAPADFSCPPGQKLKLAVITWTNVRVEDKTNSITETVSGSFSRTLIELKN